MIDRRSTEKLVESFNHLDEVIKRETLRLKEKTKLLSEALEKAQSENEDLKISQQKTENTDNVNFVTLENTGKDYSRIIGALILSMLSAGSSYQNGYYKGKCDAYESIFIPNKQEENTQKARKDIAILRKYNGKLNENDISK